MSFTQRTALSVLDQLAGDGTPASASQLMSYLWDSNPVIAAAAAWRLAPVLRASAMRAKGDLPVGPPERDSARWAWEPFDVPALIKAIVGRVVWLLANSPGESVPSTVPGQLAAEIVIPALVLVGKEIAALPFRRVWHTTSSDLSPEARLQLEAGVASGKFRTESPEQSTRWNVEEGLSAGNARHLVRELLHCLPGEVQEQVTQNFKYGRVPTPDDWLALYRPAPKRPTAEPNKGRGAGRLTLIAIATAVWAFIEEYWLLGLALLSVAGFGALKVWARAGAAEGDTVTNPLRGAETMVESAPLARSTVGG